MYESASDRSAYTQSKICTNKHIFENISVTVSNVYKTTCFFLVFSCRQLQNFNCETNLRNYVYKKNVTPQTSTRNLKYGDSLWPYFHIIFIIYPQIELSR